MRPESINHLLEELRDESFQTTVGYLPRSRAMIYLHPNDREGIELIGDECGLVFHSANTIDRFVDCLEGGTEEASIELCELVLEEELITHLETIFNSVDES